MKWLPVDLGLVSLFAVIGRLSHHEAVDPMGWWHTAWPFLVAAVAGWALVLLMRRTPGSPASGAIIWVATVAGGMLLRRASGQGTALAFVMVATVVLGLLLLGARFAARDSE